MATRPLALLRVTRQLSAVAAGLRRARLTGDRSRPGSLRMDSCRWLPRAPRDLLRAYFAWLDVRADERWARDAARVALTLYRPGVHRAVITCGPPHEVHAAGADVARATGLPLVLDLRDPWSLVQRLPEAIASRMWIALARSHERRAVDAASLIVTNTAPLREAMAALYPRAAHRMLAVTNGWDDDPLPPRGKPTRFVLAYAGSIYLDRDPRPLFRGAAQAIRALRLDPSQFGLEFMGEVERYDGVSLTHTAREAGIAPFVTVHGARPRAEALSFLAGAAMLVILPQDSYLAIPAKLFDYMRFDAWLLALTEPGSATGRLLRGTAAHVVIPDDATAIGETIARRVADFQAGRRASPLADVRRFSRRDQADRLFRAVEQIAGQPGVVAGEAELCAAS